LNAKWVQILENGLFPTAPPGTGVDGTSQDLRTIRFEWKSHRQPGPGRAV